MNDARVIEEAHKRKTAAEEEAQSPAAGSFFLRKSMAIPGNKESLGHDLGGQAQGLQDVLKAEGHGQGSPADDERRPSARGYEPSPGTPRGDLL